MVTLLQAGCNWLIGVCLIVDSDHRAQFRPILTLNLESARGENGNLRIQYGETSKHEGYQHEDCW